MHQLFLRTLSFIVIILISCSCATTKRATQVPVNISSLKYLGGYEIPYDLKYKNTIVGGLSGIDYDAKHDLYYMISDDRADKNPVRFYCARIFFTQNGIDSLVFTDVINILQPDGSIYPNRSQDPFKNPDPEAIRYNPQSRQLVWSSEGERVLEKNDTVLVNPSVLIIEPGGKYIDSFALPANMIINTTEKGPRRNGVFEGISYADNFNTLFVNIEEPLFEDGPRADTIENDAFIRILKFDVADKKCIAQYAYKLEKIAHAPKPETAFKINGASDILNLGNNKLLVMERSSSTGTIPATIKLFIADLTGATDISFTTLKNNRSFIAAQKKLLLNMDDLGIYIDNLEGVTFGPLLPNGHKTLIFVADNNFSNTEKAQVLLFEVEE
jgi:hypothetical protein